MKKPVLTWTIAILILIYALTVASGFFSGPESRVSAGNLLVRPLATFSKSLYSLGDTLSDFKRWRGLADENRKLMSENLAFQSRLAELNRLRADNESLREAPGLKDKLGADLLPAGIYYSFFAGASYVVAINKGSTNGVLVDNVIVSGEGVLVGRTERTYNNYSSVALVSDPGFRVSVLIGAEGTAGIAVGALDKGMEITLVGQGERAVEGDMVFTAGNDNFPPDLLVGSIRHVEPDSAGLFKSVYLEPLVDKINLSRVYIIL